MSSNDEEKKKAPPKLSKLDRLVLKFAPKWFELLGWLTILGVLQFASLKTGDYKVGILYNFSLFIFSIYLQVIIFKQFHQYYWGTKNFLIGLLMLILIAVIGILVALFFNSIIPQIAENS